MDPFGSRQRLFRWIKRVDPDVLCLQEVKAHEVEIAVQPVRAPHRRDFHSCAFTSCRQSTSGSTRLIQRNSPLPAAERIPLTLKRGNAEQVGLLDRPKTLGFCRGFGLSLPRA